MDPRREKLVVLVTQKDHGNDWLALSVNNLILLFLLHSSLIELTGYSIGDLSLKSLTFDAAGGDALNIGSLNQKEEDQHGNRDKR